jgi:iron complex outermembrane receptor protein
MTAASLLATPALAQSGQAADDTGGSGVNEIVVTAQRREQSVLDVPLSIQAATGVQLQNQGIKQITDLQFTTPGYNVTDSNGYTQIYIRGIGNNIFVGADPSVATFIDDVPRIYGTMVNNFVNVQRVEVLKGAQGGLYGRNATGGVVNIITRQPSTDEVKADVQLDYASHETIEADAYINVPLSNWAALSVSGQRRYSHPYFKNIAPKAPYTADMFPNGSFLGDGAATAAFFNSGVDAHDVGNQNFWAVDGKLLIRPSDNFKVTFAGDYSLKNDSQGNAQFEITPAYEQAVLGGTFQAFGIGATYDGDGVATSPPNLPAGFIIGNPGKFKVANGTPGFVYLKDYGFSGTAVLSLNNIDLTSITAYRRQHTFFLDDLGASSAPSSSAEVDNHKHYFYQELRAVSSFDGPFQFIAGATYLKSFFAGNTNVNILTPLVSLHSAESEDRVKNWSVYAQASYDLTDNLSLTASGRYVHERNSALFLLSGGTLSSTEHKFLPSATVSYKLAGGGNIYARWARGFKAGGVNPVADVSAFEGNLSSGSVFKGETVDTYEAGYRSSLFGGKVQLTADVFYNDYKNLQTSAHANAAHANSVILAIINAGSARTYGIEGTLDWRVLPTLTLGVNAGYLNAKYKNFSRPADAILDAFDYSGTRMTNSPKLQASFSANLDQPVTSGLNLTANVLVNHTSAVLWQLSGLQGVLPPATDNGYWLTNARIGIKTSDDRFGLSLFANNLFNTPYTTFGNSNAGNATQMGWGNPRIIGVEATMHM